MVICLERGADLHMAQLLPLPLTISCSNKIQIGFAFLVPAHLGSPIQRAVKRTCVCVRVRVRVRVCVCACVRTLFLGSSCASTRRPILVIHPSYDVFPRNDVPSFIRTL